MPRVTTTAARLPRRYLLGVFLLAAVIRLGALVVSGPKLGVDSLEYLAWAHALSSGLSALPVLRVEHAPLYGLFLAAGLLVPWIDLSWFAALSQSVLGALTAVVVARLTARETHNPAAGLGAGAIAAVQVSFVFWTTYVLSDTLFLLLVAVCADRVLTLRKSAHAGRGALLVGTLAILCVAARPTGAALFVALLPVVVLAAHRNIARLAALLGGYCLPVVLIGALVVFGGASARVALVTDWARSAIENGLLWTETGRGTAGIDLDVHPPPVVQTLPASQRDEFLQDGPLTFAGHHPEFVFEQAARKLRTFWAPVLPEYSLPHALGAGFYFSLFGILALVGLTQAWRFPALATLVVVGVAGFALTSMITIVDYDLRYRLPAELLLVPVAGLGLARVIERLVPPGWLDILASCGNQSQDCRGELVAPDGGRDVAAAGNLRNQHRLPVPE
jgi:hypothetical protein